MKQQLMQYVARLKELWSGLSKGVRFSIIGGAAAFIILLVAFSTLISAKNYVPLYNGLSPNEVGQIKQVLEGKGITYEIGTGGTSINVPKDKVNDLKVELAAQGIPSSGEIDYSFFGKNTGFGMTDKEFNVLERAAIQNELAGLMVGIDGVKQADVMITMPEDNVWLTEGKEKASASIVLALEPGADLNQDKINGLFHLVSKSIPNLPVENIVIMDQFFNYYERTKGNQKSNTLTVYQQHEEIKKSIEQNIQRRVGRMLGMMMGRDKVIVNVTTAIDFTKEKRQEELVEPVNQETMEGLQVSAERITETYTDGTQPGGVTGTGNNEVTNYQSQTVDDNGYYKRVEERINNAFNHIHKEVVESPYQIKDMSIQVMVEPPEANNPQSLTTKTREDIQQILSTIIRTTLNEDGGSSYSSEEIGEKAVVTVEKFSGKVDLKEPKQPLMDQWWPYIIGGIIALIIFIIFAILLRSKRNKESETVVQDYGVSHDYTQEPIPDLPKTASSPGDQKRQKIEGLAKDNPDEIAKLLRSWLSED